jgi:MFS family permease
MTTMAANTQPAVAATSATGEAPVTVVTGGAAATGEAAAAPGPLRRNWRFQTLWVGSTGAMLGLEIADLAYPLLILGLTRSPAMAGLFGFAQLAAMVACGLPAGALLDRHDRRLALIAGETTRAVVCLSVAVALILHHLTAAHLIAAGVVLGAGTAFSGAARLLATRAVVPPAQLTRALTQEEVRNNGAALVGPPLGGVLYALGTALPLFAAAAGLLVSAASAVAVRFNGRATTAPQPAGTATDANMGAGLRLLWRTPMLRVTLGALALVNLAGFALPLVVIVLLRGHGGSPHTIGLVLGAGALGGLLGAPLIGTLHRLLRPGHLLVAVTGWIALAFAALAVPLGPWWMALALCVAMLGVPAVRVLLDVLIFRQVPDAVRGRTIAATVVVLTLGTPLGALVGGLLLQFAGGTGTVLALAGVITAAAVTALASRSVRAARWPEPANAG